MACTLQADCHIGKVALAAPEDIASAPAFLAGPDGGWVNGQVLRQWRHGLMRVLNSLQALSLTAQPVQDRAVHLAGITVAEIVELPIGNIGARRQ